MRKRALLGIGKVDYGSIDEIFPKDKGVEVIGASSDHTILDIEDEERDIKVGDVFPSESTTLPSYILQTAEMYRSYLYKGNGLPALTVIFH